MNHSKIIFSIAFLLLTVTLCYAKGTQKIYVADRKANCTINPSGECMQIKENTNDAWKTISDSIVGFNYEEGNEYKLKVEITDNAKDASRLQYKLVKILSQKKTGYNPAEKLENKKWYLQSMYDGSRTLSLHDTVTYIQFNVKGGKFNGKGICNGFTGKLKAEGASIVISDMAYTKMKCVDQGNLIEQIISELLRDSNTYVVAGNTLTLIAPKGSKLLFVTQ